MKILYLSCHSILEFDEVKLLHGLGHYVFSPGAYVEPANPGDASLRPGIPGLVYDPADMEAYHKLGKPGIDNKDLLTKEFVDRFDAVIVMHMPRWVQNNWEAMKHKPVIWRTIGQSIRNTELSLRQFRDGGLKIVRYSPKEETIPGYIGSDALIRFYKDPADYGPYTGEKSFVITFNQSLPHRGPACNYPLWEEVTAPLPRKLFGPGNDGVAGNQGKVSFEDLRRAMCEHRAYFYVGTHPASYTLNFMESWMSGIPVVAIGPKHGNAEYFPGHELYEVSDLIANGTDGFWSDNPLELRTMIAQLLGNATLARQIGEAGRAAAIKHFGIETIKPQWQAFLESL